MFYAIINIMIAKVDVQAARARDSAINSAIMIVVECVVADVVVADVVVVVVLEVLEAVVVMVVVVVLVVVLPIWRFFGQFSFVQHPPLDGQTIG